MLGVGVGPAKSREWGEPSRIGKRHWRRGREEVKVRTEKILNSTSQQEKRQIRRNRGRVGSVASHGGS